MEHGDSDKLERQKDTNNYHIPGVRQTTNRPIKSKNLFMNLFAAAAF